ncbi:hypothetical protein FRC06_004092, partial [Ceratobasidium sp. 370]
MPPKRKANTERPIEPIVTRSGRTITVPNMALPSVAKRVNDRVDREVKHARNALAAAIESQPVVPEDPNFVHAMVEPSQELLPDNTNDSDTEESDRVAWLLHAIAFRDGNDWTKEVKGGYVVRQDLEDLWVALAEKDEDLPPAKKTRVTVGEPEAKEEPPKYPGITSGSTQHPLRQRGKGANSKPGLKNKALLPTPSPTNMQVSATSAGNTASPLSRTDSTTIVFGQRVREPMSHRDSTPATPRLAAAGPKSKPTAPKPATRKPTTSKPAASKPAASKSAASKPAASKSTTSKAVAPVLVTPKHVALNPTTPKFTVAPTFVTSAPKFVGPKAPASAF